VLSIGQIGFGLTFGVIGSPAVKGIIDSPKEVTIDVVDLWNSGATSEINAYLNEANRAFAQANIKFKIGSTTEPSQDEHGSTLEGIHGLRGQSKGQASQDIIDVTKRYRKSPNHILAFFFDDWDSGYIDRENGGRQIAGEACNFSDFPPPISPSCFIRSASREVSGLGPFAHELGHLLLDDPLHQDFEPGNLMNTFSSGNLLTKEQLAKIRNNLPRFGVQP
jgi:hypothetical protein